MTANDQSARIAELELLLQEANETLDAIRNGEVDAIVVGAEAGQFVYTLENADRPYRVLVEQMKEGAVTLNEDGLILYVNKSFCALMGQEAASLIGSRSFDHIEDPRALQAILHSGASATTEVRLVTASGVKTANMSIVELQVEQGAPRMFCSIVTDLTDMRNAEETMRQVQKMDAVGQLTGGIAHDFNNLLMAISSSLSMLEKRVPDDAQTRRLIDNAQQGAQRGAALTQRMLAFARRQDLTHERVNVSALTSGIIDLMQRTLGPTWPIHLDFPNDLPTVLADGNQLEMALLNLAVNARDAMPQGGRIVIRADETQVGTNAALGLVEGRYIRLSVIDEGEGMDAETLQRATEPFFTTKGVGKGTGLGLSMVHGLAKQLNGTFLLKSALGEGTSACLWLPAADGAEEVHKPAPPVAEPSRPARVRILVVDDDALIRMNVAAMLEDMDHEVLEADSGADALAILRRDVGIQLLITDQAMPNMTGTELIRHVADDHVGLPIILATGYGELPTDSSAHIVKIGKPFSQLDLARAVEKALEGAPLG